jgi:hypothetical protein
MKPSEVAARMVVAEDLGLSLFFRQTGEYVVWHVLPDSIAAEDEKIQPGDIVCEIDGISLHHKSVAEVNTILMTTKSDNTVMLVRKTQDVSVEFDLVHIVMPKLAPSLSPSLTKTRQSMLRPDITDLISTGDPSISMSEHPSFEVH